MKVSTRTWTDANDNLYHKSITITRDDGMVETIEGKGKTIRDAKADVDRMYSEFMEAEPGKNTEVQISSKSSKLTTPTSIEAEHRPLRVSRFSDAVPKTNTNNTPREDQHPAVPQSRSKPLHTPPQNFHFRSQPQKPRNVQNMHRSNSNSSNGCYPPPPQHDSRRHSYPTDSSTRGYLPGSVLPHQRNDQHGQGEGIPVSHRNGIPPRVRPASRAIANNRGRRQRTRSHSSRKEDISGNTVKASASSGTNSFRSKKIKTSSDVQEKISADGSHTSMREEEETVLEVDDSGEDWVSKLNVIKDKIKYRFEKRFDKIRYTCVESKTGSKGLNRHWACTLKIRDRKATDGKAKEEKEEEANDEAKKGANEVFISVTKRSNVKKEAKKLAAKYMIEKINDMLDKERANGDHRKPRSADGAPTVDLMLSEENAVSTIHMWWQKDLLEGKPDIIAKEVNGKPGEVLWEGVYFAKVKGRDEEFSFRERDTTKQGAKNKVALAAVKVISKLNLAGFQDVLQQKKEAAERMLARLEFQEPCPENTWDMVQLTDDEEERPEEPPIETKFSIPQNYSVCLAKSVDECESWVSRLLQKPVSVGVYVDSVEMREEMLQVAEMADYDVRKHDRKAIDCRVICLATQTSAILLNMEEFETESGTIEVPECVANIFRNSDMQLLGMWPNCSKTSLWKNYKVECTTPIVDLSMESFALSAAVHNGSRLHSTRSICDLWLKLAFQPFSLSAIGSVPGLQELIDSTDALVAPAVLAALVGPVVEKHFEQKAASMEYQYYGHMTGFGEIAKRLTSPGIHSGGRKRKIEEALENDTRR